MGSAQSSIHHAYRDIYERFVDDASFLWVLRSVALKQPHYLLSDLHELEKRITSNLDGFFSCPDIVWEFCEAALEFEEPGEVFAASIFAFRSLEAEKIQKVVEVGLSDPNASKGLISALAWLPDELTATWIEKFLRSKDLSHKTLAIAVLSAKRKDPGEYLLTLLRREDCIADEALYARMIRLVGELARVDLVPAVNSAMNSEFSSVKFWAFWSAALLGNKAVYKDLEEFVLEENPHQNLATQLYFRCAPMEDSKKLISQLSKNENESRIVIKACAALGDPQVVPWLIQKMESPDFARVSGEAFTQITGIYLEENNLDLDLPDIPTIPNDESDDANIDMDEDENLAWPDVAKIKYVWQKYSSQYAVGSRYLNGKLIIRESLLDIVRNGYQRHRIAAALELALLEPSLQLVNVNAKVEG